uniref:(California timema) hypothetical protein n=1 Tax=Timema californicum TaxID=61474 RepID=A0A7R9J1N7_TIMCA|nr:unnamed protein product [Timema californicum]
MNQVSLWGGDASFHNLDLRLEVLEEELQLPFSFVSGHIHELLIHVPWTKLASEPISITINTIECILKLRGADSSGSDSASTTSGPNSTAKDGRKKGNRRQQEVVTPPGYVQSLVNKIVNNITIICNNLILKYVEEDIVLSVNVRTVTLQSANEQWEPAFIECLSCNFFSDLTPPYILLRKIIGLSDLTICLDKRNASGKIEMYQEPLLYRCSLELHLLRSYFTTSSKQASLFRMDVHCQRMDFSLTEQQVPMLMRLIRLAIALHGKELRPDPSQNAQQDETLEQDVEMELEENDPDESTESWVGWAWNWIPAVVPLNWDDGSNSGGQYQELFNHTVHTGFYVEQASVSLKLANALVVLSSTAEDGEIEVRISAQLLEKSPAIAVDFLYMLEVPEDYASERLSELGSDLEYSNLSEKSLCRIVMGQTILNVSSGLFHRVQMLRHAAKLYDYSPYSVPKPENVTVTCTKPKLLMVYEILYSTIHPEHNNVAIYNSSLIADATRDKGMEYLELCLEEISYRNVLTPVTMTYSMSLGTIKAFVLEQSEGNISSIAHLEPQQALVFSGPETTREKLSSISEDGPLLSCTVQSALDPTNQVHPPLLIFHLGEVRACVDPLLWRWLHYCPEPAVIHQHFSNEEKSSNKKSSHIPVQRSRKLSSEVSGGGTESTSRQRPAPKESVHSSSDREQMLTGHTGGAALSTVAPSKETPSESVHKEPLIKEFVPWWSRKNLLHWFPLWRGLILCGDVGQFVMYLPTSSLSAVGSQSIEDALNQCLKSDPELEVFIIKFPSLTLRSSSQKLDLHHYTNQLPVKLSESIWTPNKISFPWSLSLSELSCCTQQNGESLNFLKPTSANATIGISTKYKPDQLTLSTLGLCVHVDTAPITLSVSEEQISLMTRVFIAGLLGASLTLNLHTYTKEDPTLPVTVELPAPVTPSPSFFKESIGSRGTPTSLHETEEYTEQGGMASRPEEVKMTLWMQSTLTRLSLSLYTKDMMSRNKDISNNLKLTFDMEDIMTSLDLQEVYFKVKCKVSSAGIRHFKRINKHHSWQSGAYLGIVMRAHEDNLLLQHAIHRELDDSTGAFLSFTFTRARCKHVHGRWGARKQTTLLANTSIGEGSENILGHPTRYISEIVVKLQPVDFVFSPATLESFLTVAHPLLLLSGNIEEKVGQTHPPLKKWARRLNNNNLPLLYVDTRSVRLIMPATDLTDVGRIHDVCMIQFDSIALTPQADNPLGRIVVRPDIYHLAEQEHILGVPGSEVEDRQYQLNVLGLCVNTGTWKELDRCLGQNVNSQLSSLTLRTMNENPALEWNNLMCGVESIMPHMTLLPVVQRVDLCVVAAPAILYKDVLTASIIPTTELLMLLEPLIADSFYHSNYMLLPMASLPNQTSDEIEIFVTDYNKFADSGIDCADISSMSGEKLSVNQIKDGTTISSINTPKSSGYHADVSSREKREHPVTLYDTRHPKTRENPRVVPVHKVASKESMTNMKRYPKNTPDKPELVPIEILFTASTVSGVLYQVLGTTESNLRELTSLWRQRVKQRITSNPSIFTDESGPYFSSNETSTDDVSADDEVLTQGKNVQPLLYIFFSQPHSYISRLSQSRKIQISCFDISIRTCIDKSFHCHNTPKLENFPTILLETKSGDPHQETGIPPSFLTVIWSKGIGKPAKLEIDLGRPTKCHLSVARLNYLEGIVRKIFDIYSDSDNILESAELTFQRKDMHRDVAGSRIDEEKEMFFLHYDSIERPSFIEKNPNVTIPDGTLSTTHISSLDLQSDYKNIGDGDQTQSMVQLQHLLWQVSEMSVKTQQIVLSMETTEGFKVLLSLLDLTCGVSYQSRQVDRVTGNVAVNSLTITTYWKNEPRLLLNPWTFTVNVCLAWEPWCKNEATPQIQVTADSDCILIDVGPDHLRCLHYVWQEYQHLIECFSLNNSTQYDDTRSKVSDSLPDQEQHYRDDLRAGAFQYLDSTNTSRDELPLPYQVVFWGSPPTMAWRYPQPRALTRVDVFPVPFKLASVDHFARGQRDQVVCSLQYWSECRSSYQHYARFQLSESEMCRLNLPHPPHRVVACTWRVQLFVRSPDDECDDTNGDSHNLNNIHMSPRALAACMRIDSFFSPHLVPHLQVAVNFSSLQVGLYNHLCISTTSREMPPSLGEYAMDNLLPDSQCFSTLELNKASLFFCLWPTGVNMLEIGSIIQCSVIDYAYLTQQYVVEPCQVQLQLSVGEKAELSCVTKAFTIKLGPGIGHTLSVSTQLWLQALESFSTTAEKQKQVYQVIVSRYVICNNTTRPLRFGQAGTDEDILLASKHCHLYSWRTHKVKQLLRVGVEEGSWVWCQPFMIDKDGTEWCPLKECGSKDLNLLIQVVSLSTTQKKIIIAGQLLITNLLVQNLECQVVPIEDESSRLNEGQSLIALGNSTPASILLDNKCKMGLRIRFHRREATWSSNIPLRENTKHGKPWLVKLPLLDSVQFLRVWCRVICQKLGTHGIKILAMLCPVYMIRSYLPIPAKALIDTPGLNVHLESTVNGKGEEQQLYCPGTIDHSHQLTFQLENGIPPSNPYVPLSYSMLDQHTLKSSSDEDIDIDHVLRSLNDNKSKTWPFLGDVYENVDWISAEQPETHVQVKYVAKDPFCSTLLVDLQPWALFANVLGIQVYIIEGGRVICTIPHKGIVTPPKLEGTFHIGIEMEETIHSSPPLQLARADWGSSFYMPRIAGQIPLKGEVQTIVQCNRFVGFASISADLVDEMRTVNIRSSFVICNYTSKDIYMTAVVSRNGETHKFIATNFERNGFYLHHKSNDDCIEGQPIIYFSLLGEFGDDLVPYVLFKLDSGWSCPVRLNNDFVRQNFTIPFNGKTTVNSAFVITSQKKCGQVFLSIHTEPFPQIMVINNCQFGLMCAQGNSENDGRIIPETAHIEWWCTIQPQSSAYYTMPISSERFPYFLSPNNSSPLVLALTINENNDKHPLWSPGVNIMEIQEQFVPLPGHGDVKVKVEMRCHTTCVTVETVSHVEISARDIRSRLSSRYANTSNNSVEAAINPLVQQVSPLEPDHHLTPSSSEVHVELQQASKSSSNSTVCTINSSSYKSFTSVKGPTNSSIYGDEPSEREHFIAQISPKMSRSIEKKITTIDTLAETQFQPRQIEIKVACFFKGLNIMLTEDLPQGESERTEVVLLSLDDICLTVEPKRHSDGVKEFEVCFNIGDLQLDNQMFRRGGFDFPVILIGQASNKSSVNFSLTMPAMNMIEQVCSNALITVVASIEKVETQATVKHFKLNIGPLCAYIEDSLVIRLMDYFSQLLPHTLVLNPPSSTKLNCFFTHGTPATIPFPREVLWSLSQLANPLRFRTFTIEPMSLMVSIHASKKIYIAVDHSPLYLALFERHCVVTTAYKLGNTLALHYLYGAIFGVGWVVGSMELLGNPGGLARTLGTGLRDFVYLPYQGILQGPWGFFVGVTHGSASLMKHITAGTLSSVTNFAASVARNLDRLTLDQEHFHRTEEVRRQRPQGVAQGLLQGLTGLGISLLGAVGGIAHHPLQSMMSEGASPRSLVTGVGRGLVGVITKPLSGAAELVALTGQGLLHGTGWTTLPNVRQEPVIEHTFCGTNSQLKYNWKLVAGLASGRHTLLHVTEATCISPSGIYEPVALVLTTQALFLINTEEDTTQRVLSLSELSGLDHPTDPTLLCFQFQMPPMPMEMDPTSHARVVEFVRRSSGMVNFGNDSNSDAESSQSGSPLLNDVMSFDTPLTFYVNPQLRNYFLSVLALAKRQSQGRGFAVL